MNSDRFNYFAKVVRTVPGNDLAGTPDTEAVQLNCWGSLTPVRGTEYVHGQQMQSESTHRFRCWMTVPPIDQHHHLLINDKRYDVVESRNDQGQNIMQEVLLKAVDGVSS